MNQSASIIKQSDVVITNDTGLMHIAAAFKKKIISVWGNTVPEFGMSPYYPVVLSGQGLGVSDQVLGVRQEEIGKREQGLGVRQEEIGKSVILEVNDLSCRPCSKIGFDKCPKGHFKCMMDIEASEVVECAKDNK